MTIPDAAIRRFEQLQQFAMIASATSDGLRPEAEHWREQVTRLSMGLSDVRRTYGEVSVGENGWAYISRTRKAVHGDKGHQVETYSPDMERRPDLDSWTLPIWNAQQRLAAVREQQAVAGERAGALRRVVEEAKQALQARGWKEAR